MSFCIPFDLLRYYLSYQIHSCTLPLRAKVNLIQFLGVIPGMSDTAVMMKYGFNYLPSSRRSHHVCLQVRLSTIFICVQYLHSVYLKVIFSLIQNTLKDTHLEVQKWHSQGFQHRQTRRILFIN